MGISRQSSVFDAGEMFALAHAAKHTLDLVSSGNVTPVSFFSDSTLTVRLC